MYGKELINQSSPNRIARKIKKMSWNIVVVVSDTLRTAYLSPYGNDWVHTPNLARFAEQGVTFTNAHPEMFTDNSRPVAHLHTGRRVYPIQFL